MQYLRAKCSPAEAHPHLYTLHFAQQHVLAEAAQQREKAIVHQLMSLVRNVRWSKYKNTLFLKGAFPSLFSDHACSTRNKLLPSQNKQKKGFFLTGRKKFKHKPSAIFNLLHPTTYTTAEHHRLILGCLVLSDMTEEVPQPTAELSLNYGQTWTLETD